MTPAYELVADQAEADDRDWLLEALRRLERLPDLDSEGGE